MGAPQPVRSGPKPVGAQATAPRREFKISLKDIVPTDEETPHRIVIYGPEGVGKSTFAARAPKCVMLGMERGLSEIKGAHRFPQAGRWDEVLDSIEFLLSAEHPYESLAIDTLDWLEPLCWAHACDIGNEKGKQDSIEAFGYGKGYNAAVDHWRTLLARLDELQAKRSMNVILVAHAEPKTFKNPLDEDYDRFVGTIHHKAWGLMKQWAKEVLFANYESYTIEKSGRVRGVSSGKRIIHTEYSAAFDAKNRHGLPAKLPLDWATFTAACAANQTQNKE